MKKAPRIQNNKKKATATLLQHSGAVQEMRFMKKIDCLYPVCKDKLKSPAKYQGIGDESPMLHTVFLSLGRDSGATIVYTGTEKTGQQAWNDAVDKLAAYVKRKGIAASYVKVDIVKTIEKVTLERVNQSLKEGEIGLWKKGISFDSGFHHAFLEEQLNDHALIQYNINGVFLQAINEYLTERNRNQMFCLPDDVYSFTCETFCCQKDMTVTYSATKDTE